MSRSPALFGGTLRLAAVGVGVAAVAMLLRHQPADPSDQLIVEAAPSTPAFATAAEGAWALRTDGWYIRVDGAEVETPERTQETASPAARLPEPQPADRKPPGQRRRGPISAFDHLIVHHAKAEGFDWRLIAALIFEESRFNPTSRSSKGAYGLMQVMPIAAREVGAERFEAPDDNVRTGVRYLRHLYKVFHRARGEDRLRLVLAAYNMGPSHVQDAQKLARRLGYDPLRWKNGMELMLPLLERPEIYEQLPYGYAKGRLTVAYVQRILNRYRKYQREIAGDPVFETEMLSSSDKLASKG